MTASVAMHGTNPRTGKCMACKGIHQVLDWLLTLDCPCPNCIGKGPDTVTQTRCVECILAFMDKAHTGFPDAVIRFRIDDKELVYDPSETPPQSLP